MSLLIYLLFSFFILFISIVLLFKKENSFNSDRLLGIALLFKSLIQLTYVLLMIFDHLPYLKLLFKALTPLYYILPPLIFMYFRNTFTASNGIRKFDLIHFIPFIVAMASVFGEIYCDISSIKLQESNIYFNEFFLINAVSNDNNPLIQPLIFTGYLLFIYFKYLNKFPLSNFKSLRPTVKWLSIFFLVLFCTQLAKIAKIFYSNVILNHLGDLIFYVAISLGISFIIYLVLMSKSLFRGLSFFSNYRRTKE